MKNEATIEIYRYSQWLKFSSLSASKAMINTKYCDFHRKLMIDMRIHYKYAAVNS